MESSEQGTMPASLTSPPESVQLSLCLLQPHQQKPCRLPIRLFLSQHPNAFLTLCYPREKAVPEPSEATGVIYQVLPDGVLAPGSPPALWLNGEGLFWFQPPLRALVLPPEAVTCLSSLRRTLHNSLNQILPPAPSLSQDEMLEKAFARQFRKALRIKKERFRNQDFFYPPSTHSSGSFFIFPLEAEDTNSYLFGSEAHSLTH